MRAGKAIAERFAQGMKEGTSDVEYAASRLAGATTAGMGLGSTGWSVPGVGPLTPVTNVFLGTSGWTSASTTASTTPTTTWPE